jgi:4-hydroxy-L-threonine phosphate dehydrogenase PdxA
MRDKTRIAIAAGDPAGIGPEISLRAALDPAVRNGLQGDHGRRK